MVKRPLWRHGTRLRLVLENGGHAPPKHLDVSEAPTVGSVVLADRDRRVAAVEPGADGVEAAVYLAEDLDDLALYVDAVAHLDHLDRMKADGLDVEYKRTLLALRQDRIIRQGAGSVGISDAGRSLLLQRYKM